MSNPNMLKRIATPLALAGAVLGGAACGGDGETTLNNSPEATTTVPLNPEQQQQIGELCVNGFDMSTSLDKEFAEGNVGGADSLMNSFTEVNDKGETVPLTPEVFADKLLDEVCKKPTVLASITAFMIEPAGLINGKAVAPNASSVARVKELAELYRNNDQAAFDAIRTLASVVKADNGSELVDDFSVIENQGTRIVPNRVENEVTGIKTEQITVGDLFTGYLFNYAKEGLTDKQINDREAVRTLVLIGKDGEMIIRVWIGDQQVDIEVDEDAPETTAVATTEAPSEDTTPVETTPDDSDETTPTGTNPTNNDNGGSNGTATTGGNTGGGTGTTGGNNGGGGGSGGSGSGDCGSNCGSGGEDGEEPEPTATTATPTTNPSPVTTTMQPTTTTTRPPVTSTTTTTNPPVVVTTTTTTQPWKPPVDCDPVIDVCD